jgi:hypothetical protein
MTYLPLPAQIAIEFYFQQSHSNHQRMLICALASPYLSSGMPHETKNANASS